MKIQLISAAAAAALPLSAAAAQQQVAEPVPRTAEEPVRESASDAHPDHDQAIVVTGVKRLAADVLGGISVVDEAQLNRSLRPSLGETLAKLPGVSATSFGPAASAPVLRGLSGDRVRVLTDGIGTLDLASAGPDHALSINPIIAERIEVLRGPAALLFGSSAIGGVVNVIDTRIPRHAPKAVVGLDAIGQYGSAADERSANVSLNVPIGGHFVLHADGNVSKTDDLAIGGHLLSPVLRSEALASPDPDVRELAELKGTLPNSASNSKEGALGFGYVDGPLNVGVSVTRHASTYEVPVRYSLDPAVEAEAPTIDLDQTRYDARAEIPLGGLFSQLRARAGYSNYRHAEIEDTGEIGSRFFSKGGEARLELVQRDRTGWGGTSGVQYLKRNARIRGEEKFLPDSEQRQTGLFTLQTYVAGPLRFEGGARVEFSKLTAEPDGHIGTLASTQDFATVSASLGGQYEFARGWRAGLSATHSERAPSVEELFAKGPHGGSQSFIVGNSALSPEKSNSVELTLHRSGGPLHLTGNLFYSRFSNFIFEAPLNQVTDDLPVYRFGQGKADYYGFELSGDAKLGQAGGIVWGTDFQADAVRATIRNFGPAPLIPPLRLLGAITGSRGQVDGRVEVEHAFAHGRTAPNETPTPAYTLVNAAIDWHPSQANPGLTLSLTANNLFDVDARRSTSLLKDFAPLAGRDIRLSVRLNY